MSIVESNATLPLKVCSGFVVVEDLARFSNLMIDKWSIRFLNFLPCPVTSRANVAAALRFKKYFPKLRLFWSILI